MVTLHLYDENYLVVCDKPNGTITEVLVDTNEYPPTIELYHAPNDMDTIDFVVGNSAFVNLELERI